MIETTRLYYKGDTTFNYPLKIWFRDSTAIEIIVKMKRVTDTNNIVTISYPLNCCRYIDLRRDSMYDFSSLSDTALLLRREVLPDTMMRRGGWAFYSKNICIIKEDPVFIGDTTINGKTWKLGRFNFSDLDNNDNRIRIGFFRCGEPFTLFSEEHNYYERSGCRLDRFLDYLPGEKNPFGDREISFLSSTLPDSVRKVFDSWEERIK